MEFIAGNEAWRCINDSLNKRHCHIIEIILS